MTGILLSFLQTFVIRIVSQFRCHFTTKIVDNVTDNYQDKLGTSSVLQLLLITTNYC